MNQRVIISKLNKIIKTLEASNPEGSELVEINKKLKSDLSNLREELADQKKKNGTLKGELTKLKNKHN